MSQRTKPDSKNKRPTLPFTLQLLGLLFFASAVSIVLLVARFVVSDSYKFWFLAWNLFLAWLPLLFALGLRLSLHARPWLSWQNIGLTILWLGFLPNSFYIMSDLIHLQSSGDTAVLYDIAMISSFVINGLILGYISVYIVHMQLLKRLSARASNAIIGAVFIACGFAIYLGRYLRWNTWDIILNPAGILFDLSERVINPILHGETYLITLVFSVVLISVYAVVYELVKLIARSEQS
ncbi:DUF1361 domain-containing protein [Candidatus Saccharibacteria bacterium]|nr:DUF1361 domain-containing protein [Candidatus Saccharibacteria bacterium]